MVLSETLLGVQGNRAIERSTDFPEDTQQGNEDPDLSLGIVVPEPAPRTRQLVPKRPQGHRH